MRPSETENEILISLASTLRNLSFFNKLASRSNTSRFCISTLLDFRDPLAESVWSIGDIFGEPFVGLSRVARKFL